MREQLKWYDEKADNSPWLDALAELRQRAAREGHCFQHVQRGDKRQLARHAGGFQQRFTCHLYRWPPGSSMTGFRSAHVEICKFPFR
jgi:hypothetical protein